MGNKPKRKGVVSKGERVCVDKKVRNAMRKTVHPLDVMIRKFDAYMAGKKAYVTMENPNKTETNKRFIRVPAEHYWGPLDDRKKGFTMRIKEDEQ